MHIAALWLNACVSIPTYALRNHLVAALHSLTSIHYIEMSAYPLELISEANMTARYDKRSHRHSYSSSCAYSSNRNSTNS